jgi:hypothetical protein
MHLVGYLYEDSIPCSILSLWFGLGVLHCLGNKMCPERRSSSSSLFFSAYCFSKSELKMGFHEEWEIQQILVIC